MGMFFQGDELLIILVILLLILGPSKLPALARGIGQAVREFKKASEGFYDEEATTKTKTLEKKDSKEGRVASRQVEAEEQRS